MSYPQEPDILKTKPTDSKWHLLELIQGVLFEPVKTMPRVVENPPLTQIVLLFTLIKTAVVLTGLYTIPQTLINVLPRGLWEYAMPGLKVILPVMAVFCLVLNYIKWFTLSGIFQLAAEFFGGSGRGRVVFAVTGLAVLPEFIMIIAWFLTGRFNMSSFLSFGILFFTGLVSLIWSILILILGVRAAHVLSTVKAAITVVAPVIFLIGAFLITCILLLFSLATV